MNDTLVSVLNAAIDTTPAGSFSSAGKNRTGKSVRPARSFAEVSVEVDSQLETNNLPTTEWPDMKGEIHQDVQRETQEAQEVQMMVAMMPALRAQALTLEEDKDQSSYHEIVQNIKTATDAVKIAEIFSDKEVKGAPLFPHEFRSQGDFAKLRAEIIQPADVVVLETGSLSDTILSDREIAKTEFDQQLFETVQEAIEEITVDYGGTKEIAASSMEMDARLAVLSHDVVLAVSTRDESEEAAEAAPLAESRAASISEEIPPTAPVTAPRERSESDGSAQWAGPSSEVFKHILTAQPARRGMIALQENREAFYTLAQTALRESLPVTTGSTDFMTSQVIRQIAHTTALGQTGSISQIRLQLNPEFLGRVNIVLIASEDGLTARIQTQNGTVRDILASNLLKLQNELRDMGIHMKSIDITQSNLSGNMTDPGGRSFGRYPGYQEPNASGSITMARFHQAVRAPSLHPEALTDRLNSYANPYTFSGEVDFRA